MSKNLFSSQFKQACYWKESMEWPLKVAPKDLPATADVVVIGSGFTGLSAAHKLAKSGAQVVVLDQQEIGGGASSRNGGIVHPTLGVSAQVLIDRYGVERAKALYPIVIKSMEYLTNLVKAENIDCHFNYGGAFEAAVRPKHIAGYEIKAKLLKEVFNHHSHVIHPNERSDHIGSETYHGGWHDPLGATLHPARLVSGLGEAAQRAEAELHPFTPALGVETDGSTRLVRTPRGDIRADAVVLASNGYTGNMFPDLRKRLIPLNIVALATEPLPSDLADKLFPKPYCYWDSSRLFFYYQRTKDDRIVFGGVNALPVGGTIRKAKNSFRRFRRIFPELNDYQIDYAWDGNVAITFDRIPHLGQSEGLFYALGFNGDGVLLGTYLGSKIAEMVIGKEIPSPLAEIKFQSIKGSRWLPRLMPFARMFFGVLDTLGI